MHHQLEGDSGEGAVLGEFKAKAASIGPQLRYQFPKGVAVAAKYQKEFGWCFKKYAGVKQIRY